MDTKSGLFFSHARLSGAWPEAEAVSRSAVTKARAKISWKAFEEVHHQAVALAYTLWPAAKADTWQGLSVFAIDGSKYDLPATEAVRTSFDPRSGLQYPGKSHYPQCLVSTVVDVFRRLPVARTVMPIAQADERKQALALMPFIPAGGVVLFDRGYPSHELIAAMQTSYQGYWVMRCPASGSFAQVTAFVQSGQTEAILTLSKTPGAPTHVRAIRMCSPDGTLSVLLSNLPQTPAFSAQAIIELYFRRWAVETQYRDEKTSLSIETFHSRTENGIRQELFAVLILAVISRVLSALETKPHHRSNAQPQLKHAILTLAQHAALLTPSHPEQALALFEHMLAEINRVLYYPPKTPRPPQPRVCKRPANKWQKHKTRRAATATMC